jgi:hypothetical protein
VALQSSAALHNNFIHTLLASVEFYLSATDSANSKNRLKVAQKKRFSLWVNNQEKRSTFANPED